jgi:phosphate transport system substrate-binding protein
MLDLRELGSSVVLAVGLIIVLSVSPAFPEEITLKLKSGDFSVSGELLDFDGENYVVKSEVLGTIEVGATKFDCLGAGCPTAAPRPLLKPAGKTIRIAGSGSVGARLMPALIRNYAASIGAEVETAAKEGGATGLHIVGKVGEKLLSIDLKEEGSAAALLALKSGKADIAMTDRPITSEEVRVFEQAGIPNMNRPGREHLIALDAVVVFVSPQNRLDVLRTEDVSRIFAGEIKDWVELGGRQARINIHAADDDSELTQTFEAVLLQRFNRRLSPDAKRHDSAVELATAVAADPAGIGFASFAEIELARPVALGEPCGLLLRPSKFSVKSGEYPLARKLYLYTAKRQNEHAAALVDFALSPAAASSLDEAGLIGTEPAMVHFNHCRDRVLASLTAAPEDFSIELMRQLMMTLGSAHRLSPTMQFESGSALLDSESIQLMPTVAAHLRKTDLSDKRLVLVGYSDNSGEFEHNRALALRRAGAVRDALLLAANGHLKPEDIDLQAYSELFPVACNDTAEGRQKNRRVEMWLVPKNGADPATVAREH